MSIAGLWAWCRTTEPALLVPTLPPPADRVELGAAAQRLLQDPTFALALDRVQGRAIDVWRNTKVGDTDGRERMYWLHAATEELRSALQQMVDNGKAAGRQE